MIWVLLYMGYRLAHVEFVSEKIEKYERWIVPIIFIGLGIYIMVTIYSNEYLNEKE
ncbi:Cad-domain-containing protein [Rhizophagus irregularis]|uniref:Cad-domain-containing protein n=1 Tax=Rhizophagus irregularis TaxID=588596 RepID=A0A2N0QGB9_9GLOM|nr:Cad-domain-containing protein [Rhizophagus irregularis]